ncbi:MAG: M15 family metallopeptidase [Bacilli bacterium]|jgi:D-alanyl-D-alanine carboxypeptidase|nr:M15 family metallopeptidase [Bacilli bacterium]
MNKNYKYYILIFALSALCFFFIFKGVSLITNNSIEKQLKALNYNKQTIELIIDYDLTNYLIENDIYSKTLEVALLEGNYIADNLTDYIYFEYKNYDKYIEHLNGLKAIGYRNDEINHIFEHLNQNEIDQIIDQTGIIPNLTNYITDQYFDINNLERYILYKNDNTNYSYEKVINYVNMNLDYNFYEKIEKTKNPDSNIVIVNKYYYLDKDFIPKNLQSFGTKYAINNDIKATKPVIDAFIAIANDAKSINLTIKVVSGYRSYDSQEAVYKRYVDRDGEEKANTYSAKPGHSEHQTGLALDIYNTVLSFSNFEKTVEYAWVKNNAHRYGFIVRYPLNKEDITGYKYEPWHIRYVGEEIATYIYENNITFDEYYAKFLK